MSGLKKTFVRQSAPEEHLSRLEDIRQDLMNLGEFWVGIEDEVFGNSTEDRS